MSASSTVSLAQETPFLEWKRGIAGQRSKQAAIAAGIALLVALSAWRCDVNLAVLVKGLAKGISLLGMFFPPEWSGLPDMMQPIGVTAVMAMIATVTGMCLSLPCALAASSNIAPAPVRQVMRAFIALERALPEVVQMLLLIALFGLGA